MGGGLGDHWEGPAGGALVGVLWASPDGTGFSGDTGQASEESPRCTPLLHRVPSDSEGPLAFQDPLGKRYVESGVEGGPRWPRLSVPFPRPHSDASPSPTGHLSHPIGTPGQEPVGTPGWVPVGTPGQISVGTSGQKPVGTSGQEPVGGHTWAGTCGHTWRVSLPKESVCPSWEICVLSLSGHEVRCD